MQQIKVQVGHENFYCPVTGELIRNDELFEPSSATVFAFIDEVAEFQQISPELEEVWNEVVEETGEDEFYDVQFEEFIQRVQSDTLVCFVITTGFGPSEQTIRIGIDMDYCSN